MRYINLKQEVLKTDLQLFADEISGLLSKGTALSYKSSGDSYTAVAAVKTIPAIGSDPEKVDVTHLGSEKKSYVKGLEDSENLEFSIIYQGKNFKDIHALCKIGKETDFKITYPDGMEVTFTGTPSFKFNGAEVNSALEFSLVVVVSKGPDIKPAP